MFIAETKGQQLPIGTCGIVNVYDATGNRTKRVYFCNNGIDPYPQRSELFTDIKKDNKTDEAVKETKEYQFVDALYPNPTTGRFFVTFSSSLNRAVISIMDNNGRMLSQFNASGYNVNFDLSPYPVGMYYVRIRQNNLVITKKVIKQ